MGEVTKFFKKYLVKKFKRVMGKNEKTKFLSLKIMDAYHAFNYQRKFAKKYEVDENLISSLSEYLHTLMIAFLLPIPKKPVLPFSITSYSNSLLGTPREIEASVKASSTVFAETSIYSIFLYLFIYENFFRYSYEPC